MYKDGWSNYIHVLVYKANQKLGVSMKQTTVHTTITQASKLLRNYYVYYANDSMHHMQDVAPHIFKTLSSVVSLCTYFGLLFLFAAVTGDFFCYK